MLQKVGIRTLHYEDASRKNWEGTAPRPLLSEVWYPAVDEAEEWEVLIGTPEAPLFTVGPAARDAAVRSGTFPLVLLSHGTGGSALQMGWLATYLAREGFVVAGVNHHGNTALEPLTAEGFLVWWERARDLSVLITLLLDDERFAGHIDAGSIGAAGFSLGGYTVIALAGGVIDLKVFRERLEDPERDLLRDIPRDFADRDGIVALAKRLLSNDTSHRQSYLDPRVRAVLAIAPPLAEAFPPGGLATVKVPVKIVVGEADRITPPDASAERYARLIEGAELTVLDGKVAHYTFLCEATPEGRAAHPELCVDAPGVDRGAVHRRVGAMASEFFRRSFDGSAVRNRG